MWRPVRYRTKLGLVWQCVREVWAAIEAKSERACCNETSAFSEAEQRVRERVRDEDQQC